jgi:hypothetical protein
MIYAIEMTSHDISNLTTNGSEIQVILKVLPQVPERL